MVLGFLSRLFGRSNSTPPTPRTQGGVPTTATTATIAAATQRRAVARCEMLDARCRIGGYRYGKVQPGVSSEAYCAALLASERVREFAASRVATIRLHADCWRKADFTALVGPQTLFELALPASTSEGGELSALIEDIAATGAGLALSCDDLPLLPAAAEQHVQLVFFDLAACPVEEFERNLAACRQRFGEVAIAIDNVGSWDEQRYCLSLGARYLLGNFVDSADDTAGPAPLGQNRAIILEMLNLLRNDGSQKDLAQAAKRDPATAVQLLTMANSPLSGFTRKVASLDQAIMALGRDALYRWLTMALFRAGGDTPRMDALLEHALYRGRFLELTGGLALTKADCDELFLIGLLSYADVLLDIPMHEVLKRMQVADEVQAALLHGKGRFGPYLELIVAQQRGENERLAHLCDDLGITPAQLDEFHLAALDWADTMLQTD